MGWGSQSTLKKEKFGNNREILSKSDTSFLSFFNFTSVFIIYFVPDILSNVIYKNKIFFIIPQSDSHLDIFNFFTTSMSFSNVWCKCKAFGGKVPNFQNRFQNRFRKALFSMCRLGHKTALKIFRILSVELFSSHQLLFFSVNTENKNDKIIGFHCIIHTYNNQVVHIYWC